MPTTQFGQYAAPSHVVAHLSDTHLRAAGAWLHGVVDVEATARRALEQLQRIGSGIDAIVYTGDLTDTGEPDAYARLRHIVEPVAAELGADIVWVMGNHDERAAFRAGLLGDASGSRAPIDSVTLVNGLRIIAVDTSVPGWHHGEIDDAQLEWLADELSRPAEQGTLLAMHHPPIPTPIGAMQILELDRQERLASVIKGSDVRAILGGHLHYATSSTLAGVPVSVAAASCYTMDLSAPERELVGIDGGRSMNLVHVHSDRIVHSVVPIGEYTTISRFDGDFFTRMEASDHAGRRDLFSRQPDV